MKRILIVILIIFLNWNGFANEKSQLLIKDFFGTVVNWTKLQISLDVSEKLPRVIIDVNDSEYGKENTAYNISEARNKAK